MTHTLDPKSKKDEPPFFRVLGFRSGTLSPTATYAKRSWVWLPVNPENPPDARIGNLTLRVQHGRGYGLKCEVDHYAVEEIHNDHKGGRCFILTNIFDHAQDQPYEVYAGDGELPPRCSCTASNCRAPSDKHLDAILNLIKEGIFDDE